MSGRIFLFTAVGPSRRGDDGLSGRLARVFFVGFVSGLVGLSYGSTSYATGAVEGGGTNNTGNILSGPSNSASSANSAGGSQGGAQAAAMAMAAAMAAMCNQPQGNIAPCILSALAAMQGGSLGKTKDGAYDNAQQYSTVAAGGGTTAPVIPAVANPEAGAAVASIKQTLAKQGAKVSDDGKTMTLPDGTSVPLTADSATDSGMKAAGLTDQQIALGKQAIAESQAKLGDPKKSGEMALDGQGGGGGGAASGGSAPADPKKPADPRARKSLSGLSKNFGSDKIGVSADDIFEMVTRRYKAKDAENAFIKN